jgi:hypothetical protein
MTMGSFTAVVCGTRLRGNRKGPNDVTQGDGLRTSMSPSQDRISPKTPVRSAYFGGLVGLGGLGVLSGFGSGVGLEVGEGDGVPLAVGVGVGAGDGVASGVGTGVAVGDGVGTGVGEGDGVASGVGTASGVAVALGVCRGVDRAGWAGAVEPSDLDGGCETSVTEGGARVASGVTGSASGVGAPRVWVGSGATATAGRYPAAVETGGSVSNTSATRKAIVKPTAIPTNV